MELLLFDFVPKYLYIGTINTNGEIRGNNTTLFFADLGTNCTYFNFNGNSISWYRSTDADQLNKIGIKYYFSVIGV